MSQAQSNIDDVCDAELELESIQNTYCHLLGEKLQVINNYESKPKLSEISQKLLDYLKDYDDQWARSLTEKIAEYTSDYEKKYANNLEVELDEQPTVLSLTDSLNILAWFVLWMGKYYVKIEFINDVCLICSKIWNILSEMNLTVKDLDNKLIWKKVLRECEAIFEKLPFFQKDKNLLADFVQKTCQLIDRLFPKGFEESQEN